MKQIKYLDFRVTLRNPTEEVVNTIKEAIEKAKETVVHSEWHTSHYTSFNNKEENQ